MAKAKSALANLLDIQKSQIEASGVKIEDVETTPHSQKENKKNLSAFPKHPEINPRIEEKKIDYPVVKNREVKNVLSEFKAAYVPTELCYRWKYANRPDDEMGDIDELAERIKLQGQKIPALVRPTENGKFEIIYGTRRWTACKKAGVKLLVLIKESLTDQEAAAYQDEENIARNNISDYARATNYKLMIERGLYDSERELSKQLKISTQTLNDIMAYIRVPPELMNLIPNFKNISRKTAVKLATLAQDPKHFEILKKLSFNIGNKKIHAENIDSFIDQYEGEGDQRKKAAGAQVHTFKDKNNNVLLSVKQGHKKTLITLYQGSLTNEKIKHISDFLINTCE